MVSVQIIASDPSDPYLRDWNIYTSFPAMPSLTINKFSGDTWTVDLPVGTYYFNVGQSGGAAYGTYSGTINGVAFSGVDVAHAAQFTVGEGDGGDGGDGEPTNWVLIAAIAAIIIAVLIFVWWRWKK